MRVTKTKVRALSSILCLFTLIVFPRPILAQGSWQPVASMQYPRHSFGSAVALDGRIYAIGGGSNLNNWASLLTSEVYNPQTNTWSQLPNLPTYRDACAAACGLDGRIYVFGGTDHYASGVPGPLLTRVDVYDPTTNTWFVGDAAPMPTGRSYLAATRASDGRIYVVGGVTESGLTNIVEIYDPANNSWTTGPPLPQAKVEMAAVTGSDARIYVIGGSTSTGGSNRCDVLDPSSPFPSWRSTGSLLQTHGNTAAGVATDGKIRAVADSSTLVEVYDPVTDTWTAGIPCSIARSRMAGVTGADGTFYVLGGSQYPNSLAAVEAFRIAPPSSAVHISEIFVGPISPNSATVTWKTDVPGDSIIEYGTSPVYGSVVSKTALTTDHSITLQNLTPKTIYYFRVTSNTPQGAPDSGVGTFETGTKGTGELKLQYRRLRRLSNDRYAVDIVLSNRGDRSIYRTEITSGRVGLEWATAPVLPRAIYEISPGSQVTETLVFPSSAGTPGSVVTLVVGVRVQGTVGSGWAYGGAEWNDVLLP